MIDKQLLLMVIHMIHHFLAAQGYHPICHIHRNHSINPIPGHKYVQVARLRCRIMAPAKWYRSP